MADSYSIINDQVVPYSGGRMHTDTDSWRDATDLELEQQARIEALEKVLSQIEAIANAGQDSESYAVNYHVDICAIINNM